MLSIDFRMTSTTLLSDLVLPAATWYEKSDLSSTDMHPYVHAFSPAIDPPWETRSDFDAFHTIARAFGRMAEKHLGVRRDVVMTPLQHDTPGETAYPGGVERDWRRTGEVPVPGRTMGADRGRHPELPGAGRAMGKPRPAGGHPRRHHQGRHRASRRRGPGSRRPARRDGQRRRRGAAGDRHRRQDGRHHPGAVRHLQRPAGRRGLPATGAPHRAAAGAPGGGQRGTADHLRRHPGPAGAGDHQPGMVGQRDRRPAVRAVHRQRRGTQALAHPDRPDALLPGPRLAAGTGRAAPGLPAAAGHGAGCSTNPGSAPSPRVSGSACGT